MKDVYYFKTQVKETNVGTDIILKFLQNRYPKDIFINVEDDKEYQKIDVDYRWLRGDKELLLEIKVDSYKSGNFFYEFYSNYEMKTIGCFEKTKADYIAYYFSETDSLYILNPQNFRNYVNKYQKWLTPKYVPNTSFHSMGYAIPIKDLPVGKTKKSIILAEFKNLKKYIDK